MNSVSDEGDEPDEAVSGEPAPIASGAFSSLAADLPLGRPQNAARLRRSLRAAQRSSAWRDVMTFSLVRAWSGLISIAAGLIGFFSPGYQRRTRRRPS